MTCPLHPDRPPSPPGLRARDVVNAFVEVTCAYAFVALAWIAVRSMVDLFL